MNEWKVTFTTLHRDGISLCKSYFSSSFIQYNMDLHKVTKSIIEIIFHDFPPLFFLFFSFTSFGFWLHYCLIWCFLLQVCAQCYSVAPPHFTRPETAPPTVEVPGCWKTKPISRVKAAPPCLTSSRIPCSSNVAMRWEERDEEVFTLLLHHLPVFSLSSVFPSFIRPCFLHFGSLLRPFSLPNVVSRSQLWSASLSLAFCLKSFHFFSAIILLAEYARRISFHSPESFSPKDLLSPFLLFWHLLLYLSFSIQIPDIGFRARKTIKRNFLVWSWHYKQSIFYCILHYIFFFFLHSTFFRW